MMTRSRGRRPTRAARILAGAVVCFALGQAATRMVVDRGTLEWRFEGAAAVLQLAAGLAQEPDVVLFGSSRLGSFLQEEALRDGAVARGATPPVLLPVLISASDATVMARLADELVAAGRRPAVAVIEVSAEQLNRPALWLWMQMNRLLTCGEMADNLLEVMASRQFNRLLSECVIPGYVHRRALLTRLVGETPPYLVMAGAKRPATAASPPAAAASLPAPAAVPPPRAAARPQPPPAAGPPPSVAAAPQRPAATDRSSPVAASGREPEPTPPWPATIAELDAVGPLQDVHAFAYRDAAARDSASMAPALERFRPHGIADRALARMVDALGAAGVSVVLLRTPVASALRVYYRDPGEGEFRAHLRTAYLTDAGTSFLDMADALPDRHFVDVHHGTRAAAAYVSYRLGERLAPLLAADGP